MNGRKDGKHILVYIYSILLCKLFHTSSIIFVSNLSHPYFMSNDVIWGFLENKAKIQSSEIVIGMDCLETLPAAATT